MPLLVASLAAFGLAALSKESQAGELIARIGVPKVSLPGSAAGSSGGPSSAATASPNPQVDSALTVLRNAGVSPDTQGALQFLRELHLGPEERNLVSQLIRQLGDDEYARREEASLRLRRFSQLPADLMNAAMSGRDAEIRWRAKSILDTSEGRIASLLSASYRVLAKEAAQKTPPEGAAEAIVRSLEYCRTPSLLESAREALLATSQKTDLAYPEKTLANPLASARGMCGEAIIRLSPQQFDAVLPLLEDREPKVSLAIARAITNSGDRRGVGTLVRLLESDDPAIRSQTSYFLDALFGRKTFFPAYGDPAQRAAKAKEWKEFVATDGQTAKLLVPVKVRTSARGDLRGNTLLATGSQGVVKEIDPQGAVLWEFRIDSWSAEKLPSGNTLIAAYSANRLVEVDLTGKVVWEISGFSAMKAKPLANGNYLVADFNGHKAIEYDREKKAVWSMKAPGECFDVERLPNGNTLIGCPNVILEATPDGKTVREIAISGRLNGFFAKEDGSIIVANYGEGKVYELSPEGKTNWVIVEPGPCDAFPLENGNLLVTTATRVVEYGPDHKEIREIGKSNYGSARR